MNFRSKLKANVLMMSAATLMFSVNVYADNANAIAQRLQPVGQVTVADATAAATPTSSTTMSAFDKAKNTYDSKCSICHKDGLAGAPKFGNDADWAPRLAATKETNKDKQYDILLASAIKGKGAMPARGTCADVKTDPTNGCSDADLKDTIIYMISGGKEPAATKK